MTVIYLTDGSKVPVPEGYTVDRVLDILRECGHEAASILAADGTVTELVGEAA